MTSTWAVVNNEKDSLVYWCYNEESARECAKELNKKENTNIYGAEIVEKFDTRDSFGVR